MVNDAAIPGNLEAITAQWLTDALRAGGAIERASVDDFTCELI